jgi:hypothetical protein
MTNLPLQRTHRLEELTNSVSYGFRTLRKQEKFYLRNRDISCQGTEILLIKNLGTCPVKEKRCLRIRKPYTSNSRDEAALDRVESSLRRSVPARQGRGGRLSILFCKQHETNMIFWPPQIHSNPAVGNRVEKPKVLLIGYINNSRPSIFIIRPTLYYYGTNVIIQLPGFVLVWLS